MKNKVYLFSASLVLILNVFFLIPEKTYADTEPKLIRGVKGTQWGYWVCHCPDDAQSCVCPVFD